MIYKGIELYNVVEIEEKENSTKLYRIPKAVCESLNAPTFDKEGNQTGVYTGHRAVAMETGGIELRFTTSAEKAEVILYAEENSEVAVFSGDYFVGRYPLKANENTAINLEFHPFMKGVSKKHFNRFDKRVWRIVFNSFTAIEFVAVNTFGKKINPPKESQVPKKKMLCYGSSITHGRGTPYFTVTYTNIAGNNLKFDVLNKAIAGGCFAEKEMLDFILNQEFDYGYFEMGTNIADRSPEFMEERLGRFIDAVCEKFNDKPLFFMLPITALSDISTTAFEYEENFKRSRSVIQNHASKYKNAILLDGHKLLDKSYYLSCDTLHPGEYGNVMMGVNFTKMIKKYIKK